VGSEKKKSLTEATAREPMAVEELGEPGEP